MNLCRTCREDFGSVSAFDRHRVGVHAYTFAQGSRMEPPIYDGRRCLAASEMETLIDKRGVNLFARNSRGTWSLARSVAYGRARSAQRVEAPQPL